MLINPMATVPVYNAMQPPIYQNTALPGIGGPAAPYQNPQQNNWILQSQQATALTRNVQEIVPAPTGELLGLMDKIGNSFGSNRLSDDPAFTRALDLATGIPGGIPGYGPLNSLFPTYPLNGRTYDSLSTLNNPQANPFNPFRTVGNYPLFPLLTPPSVFPGLQYQQPNPYLMTIDPALVNPYSWATPNGFIPIQYGQWATPAYF